VRRSRSIFITTAFTTLVVIVVANTLEWREAANALQRVNAAWLGFALAVFGLNYCLRTLRFSMLLELPQERWMCLLGVTSVYGMYNYLFPAKTGEITFPLLVRSHLDVPLASSAATLMVARLFDFGVIAVVLPVVLVVYNELLPRWVLACAIAYIVVTGAVLISITTYLDRREFARGLARGARVNRFVDAWRKLLVQLGQIHRRKLYAKTFLTTAAIWLCVYLNFYLIVTALGFETTLSEVALVSILLVPLTLIPVQGLANVGSHEVAWVSIFTLFGHSIDTSLSVAVTTHVVLLVFVMILGAFGQVTVYLTRSQNV
jgi:uncharacterized protein (TIRG00374 family)